MLRISVLLGLLTLAGCQAPWIRWPKLMPGDPAAERASFTQHDPLPDSSVGPNTSGRPREALIQRSEPRRTIEAAIPSMTAVPVVPGAVPQNPPPPSTYPNAVPP